MPTTPTFSAALAASLALLATSLPAAAQTRTMAYQGRLERDGAAQTGTYDFRFAVSPNPAGNFSCLTAATLGVCGEWAEQHDGVDVASGRFSVALGTDVALPTSLEVESELYLAISVRGPDDTDFVLLGDAQRFHATLNALSASYAVEAEDGPGFAPVGAIVAWHKSLAGVPALPSSWMECNGQTVSDAASPLNGRTLPNLNGQGRFLRGGTTSGATQADAMQGHTHDDSGHSHSYTRQPHLFSELDTGTGGSILAERSSTSSHHITRSTAVDTANLGGPVDNGQGTPRVENETRPTNMSVVWIMRIK